MRIKEILGCRIVGSQHESDGFSTEIEITFATSYGPFKQNIVLFQDTESMAEKKFHVLAREVAHD